ncbi:MAG: RsmE family RNA methyltransferase [Candidatus Peribacteria bacterium]|nr:RsmE family RNA methyltransferase [Candidatus Peribacteria bacterium]
MRYGVTLTHRTDTQLEGEIVKEEERDIEGLLNICMLIAMPNKREKAELIVQKLSEIGIDQLLFRPAERSILKRESFQKKEERLIKIAKEAVEQSR